MRGLTLFTTNRLFRKLPFAQSLHRLYLRSRWRVLLLSRPLIFLLVRTTRLHFVTRVKLETKPGDTRVLPYGCDEISDLKEVVTLESMKTRVLKSLKAQTLSFTRPAVFEFLDAELAGSPALAFDRNGGLIMESTPPQFVPLREHLDFFVPMASLVRKHFPGRGAQEFDTATLLTNAWTNNYWHWLLDVLPRLEGLDHFELESGCEPQLIVPPNLTHWQLESLELTARRPIRRVIWQGGRARVRRLVIPSFRRQFLQGHYNRPMSLSGCRWVRDRVLDNLEEATDKKSLYPDRIWVSRSDAACRRVVNEDEVLDALHTLGFESFNLSELSFAEQVRLFSQVRFVIGPHGAGLINLMFSENPTVIELFNNRLLPGNANLARILGFRYGCLICGSDRSTDSGPDSDLRVNVDQLLALLEKLGDPA